MISLAMEFQSKILPTYGKVPLDGCWKKPNDKSLIIDTDAKVNNASGAYMNKDSVRNVRSMTNNEIIVKGEGGKFGFNGRYVRIAGAYASDSIDGVI